MEVKMFVLPGCPYCKMADKLIKQIVTNNPEYSDIKIDKINELTNRKIVKDYDYYYVPAFFYGEEKLYEASPNDTEAIMKENLEKMYEKLLKKGE